MHRTQVGRFLCTAAEAVRYDSLRWVTIEPVLFDHFRQGIAVVLVKEFRAGIPACPTADTCHAIDSHIHQDIPYINMEIGAFQIKGCALVFGLTTVFLRKCQHSSLPDLNQRQVFY
jgi:hypothetical protein